MVTYGGERVPIRPVARKITAAEVTARTSSPRGFGQFQLLHQLTYPPVFAFSPPFGASLWSPVSLTRSLLYSSRLLLLIPLLLLLVLFSFFFFLFFFPSSSFSPPLVSAAVHRLPGLNFPFLDVGGYHWVSRGPPLTGRSGPLDDSILTSSAALARPLRP